jgi:hypothetical protein
VIRSSSDEITYARQPAVQTSQPSDYAKHALGGLITCSNLPVPVFNRFVSLCARSRCYVPLDFLWRHMYLYQIFPDQSVDPGGVCHMLPPQPASMRRRAQTCTSMPPPHPHVSFTCQHHELHLGSQKPHQRWGGSDLLLRLTSHGHCRNVHGRFKEDLNAQMVK